MLGAWLVSQMVPQVIQGLGQQLGLPQEMIDVAKDAAAGAVAGGAGGLANSIEELGQATGAAPSDIGSAQRQASDIVNQTVREASESEEFKEAKASGGKGGGWLMAMAKAFGAELNRMGEDLEQRASTLTGDDAGASAEFGVVSQQFNMLMNATTNAIKTIGEAMGKAASKN